MPNCQYNYKGHTFDNIMLLDDFLLRNGVDLHSKYGDLVFQSMSQAEAKAQAESTQAMTKTMLEAYLEAKRNIKYKDGEDELEFKAPYIGVTAFLRGLTNSDDELLTPEFREFEYWKHRIADWKDSNKGFNDDEKLLFGDTTVTDSITDEELLKFLNEYDKGIVNPTNLVLLLIKLVKDKWVNLGKAGTAIHAILLKLFSTILTGANAGKLALELNEGFLVNNYLKHAWDKNYLTKLNLIEIVKYAKDLRASLENTFGENLTYFPEFKVSTKLSHEVLGKGDTVLGMIDLLVIDLNGNSHVIDYKCSPKDSFNSAKERTFWYLLGLYSRMLEANNLVMNSKTPKVMVAPIKMAGFRKEGDLWIVNKVELRDADILMDITAHATLGRISENLDLFVPEKPIVNVTPLKPIENTTKFMETVFPNISMSKNWDDEAITKAINDSGGILYNEESNVYSILLNNLYKPFTGKSEAEVFNKIKEFYTKTLPKKRKDITESVLIALRKGIKENTDEVELPRVGLINTKEGASAEWFKNQIGKYCKSYYELIENAALQQYGVIAIRNKLNNLIDFIQITTDNLFRELKLAKGILLTGNFETDNLQARNANSLALKATNGNIHLMEIMSLINCMPNITKNGATIGNILVANPVYLQGTPASNEELIYNFNALSSKVDGLQNNLKDIQFASKTLLAFNRLSEIITLGETSNWLDAKYKYYKKYTTLSNELDLSIMDGDKNTMLRKLELLRRDLEKDRRNEINSAINLDSYSEDDSIARSLYSKVLIAMADLLGINFRQQLKDNSKVLESMNILNNGVKSLMLDNPGNLDNDTLNLLTKLVTEAYLNTREDILRSSAEFGKLVNNLKQSKGFGKLSELTFGNLANLYKNMIKYENGDILFKKPEEMATREESELLQYVLEKINADRFSNLSELELELMKNNNDVRYYRVPLAFGDTSSRVALTGSLFKAFKNKLKRLRPKLMWEDTLKTILGVFTDVNETEDDTKLFLMTNMFESGVKSDELRLQAINKYGYDAFENNLETLLLKHLFAYSMLRNVQEIMPMAKAAMVHLVTLGHLTNKKLTNATNYVSDYIRNKIKNESLIPKNYRNAAAVAGKIKLAASFLVLGFNPILYGYLIILGLWTDIRLYLLSKNAGDGVFTFNNLKFGWKEAYKDMFTLGATKTKCSLINEFFGLNDMDMNTYADHIKSDRYGIFNLGNIAYHCASRPDFFNRLTMFIALMLKDGTWDAYSIKNGLLIYDFKKDKRFKVYASGDKSNPKYNEQRGLYLAIAEQLVREHAKNQDGSEFKVGQPLPKAYTNLQSEGYKAIADNIYGYYSHEKKSMIHSTLWGSLWMQMKTYWSGKKNQYLGSPGVKLQGSYKLLKDANGNDLWIKEEGGKLIPTTENTGVPFMKWEGEWQEGIVATLKEMWDNKEDSTFGLKKMWNHEDPEIRKLARKNITLLGFDLLMFALIGPILAALMGNWDDETAKDVKKSRDTGDALAYTAGHMACKMVSSSFGDFNFIESIGAPIVSWQPMSFAYLGNKLNNVYKSAMGELDWEDTLIKMSSVGTQNRLLIKTALNQ